MDRRQRLVEKLGVHMECKEQLAPLAARILSTLILAGKQGMSFEKLVSTLEASKSTIFTHLTNLQATKKVSYYTKSGDRKKYFVISKDAMILSMKEMIDNWKKEKELHLEVMGYKNDCNSGAVPGCNENIEFDLEFHKDYLNFLDQATASMQNLHDKLTNKLKND